MRTRAHLPLTAAVRYLVVRVSAATVGTAFSSRADVAFQLGIVLFIEGDTSAVSAVEIRIALAPCALIVPALCHLAAAPVHQVESGTGSGHGRG